MKELEAQLFGRPEFKDNRKLEELRTENDKLHYRANILIRVKFKRKNKKLIDEMFVFHLRVLKK